MGGERVGGGGRTRTGSGSSEEEKKFAKKNTENGAMRAREGQLGHETEYPASRYFIDRRAL